MEVDLFPIPGRRAKVKPIIQKCKGNSEQPFLFLRIKLVGGLLCDQGEVAAGAVVDDEVDLNIALYGLIYNFAVSSLIAESGIPGSILPKRGGPMSQEQI